MLVISMPFKTTRPILLALTLSSALSLGGCGGIDGVELQGGVFDALGLSAATQKKEKEPRVAARASLVLPPDASRLPTPDQSNTQAGLGESWPVEAEELKARNVAVLEKQHKDYCEKALLDARMKNESGVVMGPRGNCRPGLFGSLSGMFEGEKGN